MNDLDERIRPYVDAQLIEMFFDARARIGTDDLVLIITPDEDDRVLVFAREDMLSAEDTPPFIRRKLGAPPKSSSVPHAMTFWLVAIFNEEILVGAVCAYGVSKGGDA